MVNRKSQIKFITAMLIFGSIGLFIKAINLPTPVIVLMRTVIGSLFLSIVLLLRKQRISAKLILCNLPILTLCGLVLGGSWVFLFEAYRHTTVGAATLIYYCAPIVVILLSPLILKEKLTWSKIAGVVAAIIGMVIINGKGTGGSNPSLGLTCGLISALLYAALIIFNKFIKNLSGLESTLAQLIVAAFIMIIYVLLTQDDILTFTSGAEVLLLLTLGIVHTGIACYLYFSSIQELSGQTIALLSYIDPVSALFFSAVFLNEKLTAFQIFGALLILGGTAFGQIYPSEKSNLTKSVLSLKDR